MFLIDTQNKKAVSLDKKSFSELKLSERNDLQEWIAGNPHILGENLLIIQKEFDGFYGTNERLDLLALDECGNLVIIENKLDDSGKDVVWQALKYASFCATLKRNEICKIYQQYLGDESNASEKIDEFYNELNSESDDKRKPVNGDQRIILVAANFRKEVTSTVLWLREREVDIKCVKVTPYKDGEKLYLDAEQILPVQDIDDYQISLTAKKKEDVIPSTEEKSYQTLCRNFWEKSLPILREKTGLFKSVSPSKNNWLTGASGYSGIAYNPIVTRDSVRAEFWIGTPDKDKNKRIYRELISKKKEIDNYFENKLDWQELPDQKACRICYYYDACGVINKDGWDEMISFLADNLTKFITVFKTPLAAAVKGQGNAD